MSNETGQKPIPNVQTIIEKIKNAIFTYEGTVDVKTFFGCYVLIGIFGLLILRLTGGFIMTFAVILFEGYTKSILIQKRCRDFGNDGKWYLGLYFMSYLIPATAANNYNNITSIPLIIIQVLFAIMALVWVGAFFKLLGTKSAENKDMSLTAPFMKQRKIHIAVVVAATALAVVMNILWLYLAS